eukprot:41299_1
MHAHSIPVRTLIHPQFVPRRSDIKNIKERVKHKPERQRQLKQRFLLKYCLAIALLYLINDSNVREYYTNRNMNMLLIFHGLQLISIIIFYILTISDPGYLKPNDDMIKDDNDNTESVVLIEKNTSQKVVDLSGIVLPRNFCERCKFFKPERCKHCYLCDRCVIVYDHHCPFIDHCVGIKNYRLFVSFMFVQGFVSSWTFYIAVNCLFFSANSMYNWIQFGLRIMLFLWMLYQCIVVWIMLSFHFFAISIAQTSYEYTIESIKEKHKNMTSMPQNKCCCMRQMEKISKYLLCSQAKTNKYSNGCIMNWINFVRKGGIQQSWCTPECPVVTGSYE